jgi:long-chain fatty acid transport protein
MKLNRKLPIIGPTLACGAVLATSAYGGGLSLYEIATPDVGLAAAGYAARAQDASTVYRNPAGMSLLEGSQAQFGAQLTYGNVAFTKDDSSPFLRNDNGGGNAFGALPAASLFLTIPLSDRFAVGFGSYSSFGLVTKYNSDWVGRYYIQEGALLGMSLMPAVSFKATDWLSIGAGLNAMYGYFDTKVAIRTRLDGTDDGQMKLQDSTWGFGANAGIMAEPAQGTRLGLTYQSPTSLDFKATPSFNRSVLTSPPQLNFGMTVPQSVMLSAYQELNDKWALLANVGWQNWNQFGQVEVQVNYVPVGDGGTDYRATTANLNYQDTWHGALGVQFRASEKWLFSTGVAYDSSAVSDSNRTLSVPMGQAYRIGLGAQWQVSQKVNIGAAYEFLWAGDMPVTQGSVGDYRGYVSGGYNGSYFSFFTVNANWKF